MLRPACALALVLLAGGLARARPLEPEEAAWARQVARGLELEPLGAAAKDSRRGAHAVRVRFEGLDVARFHYAEPADAARLAESLAERPRTKVEARGGAVIALRGPRVAEEALARKAFQVAWSAPTAEAIAREARRAAAAEAAAEGAGNGAQGAAREGLSGPVARGVSAHELGLAADPRARRRPRAAAEPTDLSGEWLTAGAGKLVLLERRRDADGDRYRVELRDFPEQGRKLRATFDGRVLTVSDGTKTERYLFHPDPRGAHGFRRVGKGNGVVPPAARIFWRAEAEELRR
ncbi:MAG: hypothetical protein AB7N76_23320 [Planctomycetota bacterium]